MKHSERFCSSIWSIISFCFFIFLLLTFSFYNIFYILLIFLYPIPTYAWLSATVTSTSFWPPHFVLYNYSFNECVTIEIIFCGPDNDISNFTENLVSEYHNFQSGRYKSTVYTIKTITKGSITSPRFHRQLWSLCIRKYESPLSVPFVNTKKTTNWTLSNHIGLC